MSACAPVLGDEVPRLGIDGYTGVLREVVEAYAGVSEASPEAIGLQLLVAAGVAMGANPWVTVDGSPEGTNLYLLLVGASGRSRKTTAFEDVLRTLPLVALDPVVRCLTPRETVTVIRRVPSGTPPPPLLVLDDFAGQALKALSRPGSAFGVELDREWNPLTANAHLAWIGHVYPEAVRAALTNRVFRQVTEHTLYAWVDRREPLPRPQPVNEDRLALIRETLGSAIKAAESRGEVQVSPGAESAWRWHATGPRGSVVTARIALTLALLDQAPAIEATHVRAASAVAAYSDTCRAGLAV